MFDPSLLTNWTVFPFFRVKTAVIINWSPVSKSSDEFISVKALNIFCLLILKEYGSVCIPVEKVPLYTLLPSDLMYNPITSREDTSPTDLSIVKLRLISSPLCRATKSIKVSEEGVFWISTTAP